VRITRYLSGSILLAIGALAGCGDSVDPSEIPQLLDQASSHVKAGEPQAAVPLLKNVLSVQTENAQARALLGRANYQLDQGQAAIDELERAVAAADSAQANVWLAQAYLALGRWQSLESLDFDRSPDDKALLGELLSLKAIALGYQQKFPLAELNLEEAQVLLGDGHPAVLFARARLEFLRGDLEATARHTERLLALDEGHADGWQLQGDLQFRDGIWHEALASYRKAYQLNPYDLDSHNKYVLALIQSGELESAQVELDKLIKRAGEHPLLTYSAGLLAFQQRNYESAKSRFETTLGQMSSHPGANYYAAMSNLRLENYLMAEQQLQRYLNYDPSNQRVKRLVAQLALQRGEYDTAAEHAREILEETGMDAPTLVLLANAMIAQGNIDSGVEHLEKAIEVQPASQEARLRHGSLMLAEGEVEGVVDNLEAALEANPDDIRSYQLLVAAYLRQNDPDAADEVVTRYAERFPDRPEPEILRGSVAMSVEDFSAGEAAFQRALQLDVGNPSANSGLAAIAMQRQQPDAAIGFYNDILRYHPEDGGALQGLAGIYASTGQEQLAIESLEKLISAQPQVQGPRFMLGNLYVKQGEYTKVLDVLQNTELASSNSIAFHALHAEANYRLQRYPQAKEHLLGLTALQPQNLKALGMLADVSIALGESASAEGVAERMLAVEPESSALLAKVIELELRQGKLEEAKAHLTTLRQLPEQEVLTALFDGRLAMAEGQTGEAVKAFASAHKRAASTRSVTLLSAAQWADGQQEDALNTLRNWLQEQPADNLAAVELGNRLLGMGEDEEALAVFERVLEANPDSALLNNNIAWLLRETDTTRALKHARAAVDKQPNAAEFRDTFAVVLMLAGNLDAARKEIDTALNLAPKSTAIRFHRALILSRSGREESARTVLETLLAESAAGDFPQREEAQALLQELSKD
jgi:putative PEP-CTERM system TPR-repeat lipoprotein